MTELSSQIVALRELEQSTGWKLLVSAMQRRLDNRIGQLKAVDPGHLGKVQGAVEELEKLMNLPAHTIEKLGAVLNFKQQKKKEEDEEE